MGKIHIFGDMKIQEIDWETPDGVKINGRLWQPSAPVKAVVCLVHGLGEHCARFDHVAEFFGSNGYAFISYDHRGHGKSGGNKGHIPSYELFLDDIGLLLNQAEENFPDLPKFLYGHSMGGNLALNYAIRRKPRVKGVIATGAWITLAVKPPAIKLALGKMMKKVYPGFTQPSGLIAEHISRDSDVVQKYIADPLVHDKISTALFLGVFEAADYLLQNVSKLKIPALIMHGTEDQLTSAAGSRAFAEKVEGDVTLKLWEGLYHEIHNEPEKQEVFNFMLDWMNRHL